MKVSRFFNIPPSQPEERSSLGLRLVWPNMSPGDITDSYTKFRPDDIEEPGGRVTRVSDTAGPGLGERNFGSGGKGSDGNGQAPNRLDVRDDATSGEPPPSPATNGAPLSPLEALLGPNVRA